MDDSGELGLWVMLLGGLANLAIGGWLWRPAARGTLRTPARLVGTIFLSTGAFALLAAAARTWWI